MIKMGTIPTYEQIMAETPDFVTEHDGYLYFALPIREYYDNTIWKVSKETKEVSYMPYMEYIVEVEDKAKYVVKPQWLKEESEKEGA